MYLQRYMLAVDLSSFRRLTYIVFPSDPILHCSFILSSFLCLSFFYLPEPHESKRVCLCCETNLTTGAAW